MIPIYIAIALLDNPGIELWNYYAIVLLHIKIMLNVEYRCYRYKIAVFKQWGMTIAFPIYYNNI